MAMQLQTSKIGQTTHSIIVTALVNRMRQDELVVTERSSSDKRFMNIKLMDKGLESINKAMLVAQEVVNQLQPRLIFYRFRWSGLYLATLFLSATQVV